MSCGKVEICGVDTSTLPVLTNERMRELFPLVHGGDKAAREEFIRGNLRLVLSVIQRFSGRGENVDDLFQVGCIGLIKALDNFDVSQNVRFSTYAVPMIIGEIRRYLRDNNPIRVSRSLRDTAYKALQARDRLQYALMAASFSFGRIFPWRMWSLPWKPFRTPSPSLSPFITMGATPFTLWTR